MFNPTQKEEIINLILTHDNKSQALFSTAFKAEIEVISENIAKAFAVQKETTEYINFNQLKDQISIKKNQLILYALTKSIDSLKLLSEGFFDASGNSIRCSFEALATTFLLIENPSVRVNGEHKPYVDRFNNKEKSVYPHRSIALLEPKNISIIDEKGKKFFTAGKDYYNNHSHASELSLTCMLDNTYIVYGGGYINEHRYRAKADIEFLWSYSENLTDIVTAVGKSFLIPS